MDKETLSNYGWIVICVLVLAVMIALATPFGNYVKTGVESTRDGLIETSNKGMDVALLSTGTPNNNGGNEPSAPIVRNGIIPDGATYTPNGGTAITGNGTNTFPNAPATGDTYEEGDYIYKYNQYYSGSSWKSDTSQNGWGVRVKDVSKTSYGGILSEIAGQPVTNMFGTFYNCTSLTTAPVIPSSITSMHCTFTYCRSLTTAPTIPSSVTDMGSTFDSCTSLATTPTIPSGVTNISNAFAYCRSLTTAPVIPSSVTNMFQTFNGCTSLATAPAIPSGVTNMYGTFSGCTSLTTAPVIPSSVTNMSNTFNGCTNLTTAPVIPSSVTNMYQTFWGCTFLKTYVGNTDTDGDFSNYTIPSGVTNMSYTFFKCTSLTTAPTIPNSVTNMSYTFFKCTSLTGAIEVNANPTSYTYCLKSTKITSITGSCLQTTKDALMATK